MNSNIREWQTLQRQGYFKIMKNPHYIGANRAKGLDLLYIERAKISLEKDMTVAVIGAGYGRESALISRYVKEVCCIDVAFSEIFSFMELQRVKNYRIFFADQNLLKDLPQIDLFYSLNVMQHLTRDLTRVYFDLIRAKISDRGAALIQFAECLDGGTHDVIPEKIYEPCINWTHPEIEELLSLSNLENRGIITSEEFMENRYRWRWHWANCGK